MKIQAEFLSLGRHGEVVVTDAGLLVDVLAIEASVRAFVVTNSGACGGSNLSCNNTGDCNGSTNAARCTNVARCAIVIS